MPNAAADDDIPLRTTRLRDLPPELAPAAFHYGIWNRPDRPKVVGIVGWLTVALGFLSFTIKGGVSVHYFSDMRWLNADYVAPVLTRGQFTAEVLLVMAEMTIGLLAIAAGLGALMMREWGRRLLIAFALATLAVGVAKAIYQFSQFDVTIVPLIAASTRPADRPSMENRAYFALVTSTMMMPIWPALVLTIATRRFVKRAFALANGRPLADDPAGFRMNGDAR